MATCWSRTHFENHCYDVKWCLKSDIYIILIFDKGRQDLMMKTLGPGVYLLRFTLWLPSNWAT